MPPFFIKWGEYLVHGVVICGDALRRQDTLIMMQDKIDVLLRQAIRKRIITIDLVFFVFMIGGYAADVCVFAKGIKRINAVFKTGAQRHAERDTQLIL